MKYEPHTYMGWYIYHRGLYEEGPIHLLRQLLQPGMTFIDVGANIGLYTLIGAHLVGPEGRVLALEPQVEAGQLLQENIRLNSLSNVEFKNIAASSKRCSASLHQVSISNNGQATLRVLSGEATFGEPEAIQCHTLDEILAEDEIRDVHGVKIDVEGAELDVLRGFKAGLEERPPSFILLEFIDQHLRRFGDDTEQAIHFLNEHLYDLYCLHRGHWRPLRSVAEHMRSGGSPDVVAVRQSTAAWHHLQAMSR